MKTYHNHKGNTIVGSVLEKILPYKDPTRTFISIPQMGLYRGSLFFIQKVKMRAK